MVPEQGGQYENAPQPINHAGDGGEDLDDESQRLAQEPGRHLGEIKRDPDPEGRGQQEGEERRHQGPIGEGEAAETLPDGIPILGNEETPAEGLPGIR
jgi:hypothetical protein